MDSNKFIEKCKSILESRGVELETIFVVWNCKTLQNNKAILSRTGMGAAMYEITHNGDKSEIYVDTYRKESNECISL